MGQFTPVLELAVVAHQDKQENESQFRVWDDSGDESENESENESGNESDGQQTEGATLG